MYLNSIRLKLGNLNAKDIPDDMADAVAVNNRITNRESGKIEAYDIVCLGAKGSHFSLRIPYSEDSSVKVDELKRQLNKTEVVRIVPDSHTLMISAYAFLGDKGNLISGVSVKAETFEIADNADDDEIIV